MIRREKNPKRRFKCITGCEQYEEQTLVQKLRQFKETKQEPQKTKETYFTYREDGPLPAFNIRTDRFEVGQKAAEKYGAYKAQSIVKGQDNANDEAERLEAKP